MPDEIIKVGAKVQARNGSRGDHIEVTAVGRDWFLGIGSWPLAGEFPYPSNGHWEPHVEPPKFTEGWYRVYDDGLIGYRFDERERAATAPMLALVALLHIDVDGTPTMERLP